MVKVFEMEGMKIETDQDNRSGEIQGGSSSSSSSSGGGSRE